MRIAKKVKLGFIVSCFIIVPIYIVCIVWIIKNFMISTNHTVEATVAIAKNTSKIYRVMDMTHNMLTSQEIKNNISVTKKLKNDQHVMLNSLNNIQSHITLKLNESSTGTVTNRALQTMLIKTMALHENIERFYANIQSEIKSQDDINKTDMTIAQIQNQIIALNQLNMNFSLMEEKNENDFIFTMEIVTSICVIAAYLSIFFVALFILRSITQRINDLSHTAHRIQTKEYAQIVGDNYQDELTILSTAFNSMSSSLQKSMSYITNLTHMMPNIFIITNQKLEIKDTNETTTTQVGYSKEALKNKNLLDYISGEEKNDLINFEHPIKVEFIKQDETGLPVLLSFAKIHNYETNEVEYLYFGQNISQLVAAEKSIIQSARRAGMADIIKNILHNIANKLTSINVSATLIAQKVKSSNINRLTNVHDLITEHEDDLVQFLKANQQANSIANYIITLLNSWKEEKTTLSKEIATIKNNILNIGDVLNTQQLETKGTLYLEKTSLPILLNEAIATITNQDEKNIIIKRDYQATKKAYIDRNKLYDVIVHLLKNSLEAMSNTTHPQHILEISLFEKGDEHFVIKVKDNGVGIPAENLDKIFTHGFTTKNTSHGFGLHYSSLNLVEMGGSLSAVSEGVGKGAVFTITLPYDTATIKA